MTIYELLKSAEGILKGKSKSCQLDCEVLLSFILDKDKVYLLANREEEVEKESEKKFLELVNKRAAGSPISYLLNKKEFYSIDFFVNEDVLIPRPETEDLVDIAYKHILRLSKIKKRMKVIDVGTGCGNICITLINKVVKDRLNENCNFVFYLSDISGKALNVARKNLNAIIKSLDNIKVNFVKTDLLKGIDTKLDIIVSNPPYIPDKDIEYLDKTVKDFEPQVALNGGEGGVELIKKLISQATKRLTSEGALIFEMHEDHPNIIKFFVQENYSDFNPRFYKDSFKMWRFGEVS